MDQGRNANALRLLQQAFATFQDLGDRDNAAAALMSIGDVQERQGQYSDALQSYQQAAVIYRRLGGRSETAKVTQDIEKVQALIRQAARPSP
jgi:tetratricopeptide (TPR) repeat protein